MHVLRLKHLVPVLFLALAFSPGCLCENQYALKASRGELKQVTRDLYEIRGEIQNVKYDRLEGKLDKSLIYYRIRGIEERLKKVRFTLSWSKNIDLVADNPSIISKVRREKITLAAAEKELAEVMQELRPGNVTGPVPEPEFESMDEESAYEDEETGSEE